MNLETQIIPKLEFDTPLETALAQGDKYRAELMPLHTRVRGMEIADAASYAEVGAILSQERGIRKQIKANWAPFDAIADRVRDFLRTSRQRDENLCQEIDAACLAKMKPWENREREEAAKEEKQLNKKSDTHVEVKPNLPSVAGYRKTVNYHIQVEDANKLLKAFRTEKNKTVLTFLCQFIALNENALAKYARELKDPEKFMGLVPGVKCWKD
jgi:hypothetical protein